MDIFCTAVFLSPGEDDGVYALGAGVFEDAGAFFQSGAGGSNIIYEQNAFATHVLGVGYGKSIAEVMQSCVTLAAGNLRCGVARSEEEVCGNGEGQRMRQFLAKCLRQKCRLIEAAPAQTSRMQRNGNNDVREWKRRPRAGMGQERGKGCGKFLDKGVFVVVDDAF